jgi:hypothetical protein
MTASMKKACTFVVPQNYLQFCISLHTICKHSRTGAKAAAGFISKALLKVDFSVNGENTRITATD